MGIGDIFAGKKERELKKYQHQREHDAYRVAYNEEKIHAVQKVARQQAHKDAQKRTGGALDSLSAGLTALVGDPISGSHKSTRTRVVYRSRPKKHKVKTRVVYRTVKQRDPYDIGIGF